MTRIVVRRRIAAPVDRVFETVARIENFREAVPDIVDVELLSSVESGVGTRFRETRVIDGRKASTDLEITEWAENERVRLVADSHGTVWDSLFSVEPRDGGTELVLEMEARPRKLLAKLTTPLMKGTMQKALEKDMDAVKAYCER